MRSRDIDRIRRNTPRLVLKCNFMRRIYRSSEYSADEHLYNSGRFSTKGRIALFIILRLLSSW